MNKIVLTSVAVLLISAGTAFGACTADEFDAKVEAFQAAYQKAVDNDAKKATAWYETVRDEVNAIVSADVDDDNNDALCKRIDDVTKQIP